MRELSKDKDSRYPGISMDIHPTVEVTTHYFSKFSILAVFTSLGGSMGLWLGLSVLQLLLSVYTSCRKDRKESPDIELGQS